MAILRNFLLMLLGLLAVIFLTLRFGTRFFTHIFRDPYKGIDPELAESHVQMPDTRSTRPDDDILPREAEALVEAGDWAGLSERLDAAVTSKSCSLPLKRDYELITLGARAGLRRLLWRRPSAERDAAIRDHLAAFDAAADAAPDDPGLAAIAARAHLDLAWHWRGDGFAHEVTEAGWTELMRHSQSAADRIAPFLMGEDTSPVIAHAAHIAARHQDEDGRALREAYEIWRAADAGNMTVYAEHGFHLLPRWFGDHADLAREAARAAAQAPKDLGEAPYLWIYEGVLDCEPEARAHADAAQFVDAVSSHLTLDSSSHAANRLLKDLSDLWLSEALDRRLNAAQAPAREIARMACRRIVERHLKEIDTRVWGGQTAKPKGIIALLYKDDIDQGNCIAIDDGKFSLKPLAA